MPRGRPKKDVTKEAKGSNKKIVKKEKLPIEGIYLSYRLGNKPVRAKIEKVSNKHYEITLFYSYNGPIKEDYTEDEINILIQDKTLVREEIIL